MVVSLTINRVSPVLKESIHRAREIYSCREMVKICQPRVEGLSLLYASEVGGFPRDNVEPTCGFLAPVQVFCKYKFTGISKPL